MCGSQSVRTDTTGMIQVMNQLSGDAWSALLRTAKNVHLTLFVMSVKMANFFSLMDLNASTSLTVLFPPISSPKDSKSEMESMSAQNATSESTTVMLSTVMKDVPLPAATHAQTLTATAEPAELWRTNSLASAAPLASSSTRMDSAPFLQSLPACPSMKETPENALNACLSSPSTLQEQPVCPASTPTPLTDASHAELTSITRPLTALLVLTTCSSMRKEFANSQDARKT